MARVMYVHVCKELMGTFLFLHIYNVVHFFQILKIVDLDASVDGCSKRDSVTWRRPQI